MRQKELGKLSSDPSLTTAQNHGDYEMHQLVPATVKSVAI